MSDDGAPEGEEVALARTLEAAWTRDMVGDEVHTDRFVESLLVAMPVARRIGARVTSAVTVDVMLSQASFVLTRPNVVAVFRLICVRLAVRFAEASATSPTFQGGQYEAALELDGARRVLELDFKNVSGEAWFELALVGA